MILLAALLLLVWGEAGLCRGEDGSFFFDGDLRHFAVANDTVYVATEEKLYKLSRDLSLSQSLSQKGILAGESSDLREAHFFRVPKGNATFKVNVLLPFMENDTLITCGVTDNGCGHCEILDLKNISNQLHSEPILVGPPRRNNASVVVLVKVERSPTQSATYIFNAVQERKGEKDVCRISFKTISLLETSDKSKAGIFSPNDDQHNSWINMNETVQSAEFVDGFQISSVIYLLSNVDSDSGNVVRLMWFEGKTSKVETLKSLRGVTLRVSEAAGGHRLVASSVVPGGPPVLWSGVFSEDGEQTNTQLVVFDISPDLSLKSDSDPYFSIPEKKKEKDKTEESKILRPKAVLLRQNSMTSVLAERQRAWMVFFIGTGDGQLIKLAVDKDYHTACPIVLYRATDDHQVFPKILLDPVDRKHLYVSIQNQIKHEPVSKCSTFTDVRDCWSAQDPHCVWCGSKKSCTFEDDCEDSDWLSIPDDYQEKIISDNITKDSAGQITLSIQTHLTVGRGALSGFACQFSPNLNSPRSGPLCSGSSPPKFPHCSCTLKNSIITAGGLAVTVKIRLGSTVLSEQVTLTNCSDIRGPQSSVLCQQCIRVGCGWSTNGCTWANEGERNNSVCQIMDPKMNNYRPKISSITPSVVSFYGRNYAVLSGHNLSDVTRVRMQTYMACSPQESPVWNNTGVSLMFHIPSADRKGVVIVCVVLPDGSCHGSSSITYQSVPSCTNIVPTSSWFSGKRRLSLVGSHLEFVEGITHSHAPQEVRAIVDGSYQNLTYGTPAAAGGGNAFTSTVFLKVANETVPCSTKISYYPDPVFTGFTPRRTGVDVNIVLEKTSDKLEITLAELTVWGVLEGKRYPCIMDSKASETNFFICDIKNQSNAAFQELQIMFGDTTVTLHLKSSSWSLLILLLLLLIPCIIIMVVIIYRKKQRQLTANMNRRVEAMEFEIRNDIRQGFVDLQTERADLVENVGAIPFLDYKHFASKIFFPKDESLMKAYIRDIGQEAEQVQLDECCQRLSTLLQDQLFLTSMVHAMEEQKSFNLENKCTLASLLTVALHGKLLYLTEVMEVLLKDLMQQNSNTQSKLLLRRTESTVEKLLTNWMSICLYGFLRESVGQHLFVMVSALTQQTAKGPVDSVTEKALYTLSEDWLLWQAPDFDPLKLQVLFAVGNDGEVSEPLEVNTLTCDTVEQLKEKILSAFKAKFGFPYGIPLGDMCIEHERDGSFVPLQEVDASSEVIGEVTMLNTLQHYGVLEGATIKVLFRKAHPPVSPQGSLRDDENFSGKYFHLIDPDVVEDQRKNPERKKLKLKEVHLTKLLSTKVAVHSYVESLFSSIWGMQLSKAPPAVKYFFDFLDNQADNMRITDPDVLHIWKTNSLPLRFWVNILKNPQFVFDMEKTPHLDGCLSVIAQAFMDSFSLSETQLGKHAPTNKLLYAKDIPKFKKEVKAYYKQIRDQPPITHSEFKDFLQEESKKHENEFNEAAALRELHKFIQRYFTEIKEKLHQNGAPPELTEQLHHVKDLFDGLRSCSWN